MELHLPCTLQRHEPSHSLQQYSIPEQHLPSRQQSSFAASTAAFLIGYASMLALADMVMRMELWHLPWTEQVQEPSHSLQQYSRPEQQRPSRQQSSLVLLSMLAKPAAMDTSAARSTNRATDIPFEPINRVTFSLHFNQCNSNPPHRCRGAGNAAAAASLKAWKDAETVLPRNQKRENFLGV